jgi:hypothetical protein
MGIVPIQLTSDDEREKMTPKQRHLLLAHELMRASAALGGARLLNIAANEFTRLAREADEAEAKND